jgi:micrococcal nuclease
MKTSKTIHSKTKAVCSFLFLITVVFGTNSKIQAQTIPIDSVKSYLGKTIKVCDKVYGTHVSKGEKKTTTLNLGADYPNQKLAVVIFEKDLPNFGYTPAVFLKDKNVCVTGKLMTYKDRPEIIVSDTKDITYE